MLSIASLCFALLCSIRPFECYLMHFTHKLSFSLSHSNTKCNRSVGIRVKWNALLARIHFVYIFMGTAWKCNVQHMRASFKWRQEQWVCNEEKWCDGEQRKYFINIRWEKKCMTFVCCVGCDWCIDKYWMHLGSSMKMVEKSNLTLQAERDFSRHHNYIRGWWAEKAGKEGHWTTSARHYFWTTLIRCVESIYMKHIFRMKNKWDDNNVNNKNSSNTWKENGKITQHEKEWKRKGRRMRRMRMRRRKHFFFPK